MMSNFRDSRFQRLQLRVKFNEIPHTRLKTFRTAFGGYTQGLVRSTPGNFVMTPSYGRNADKFYRFAPRPDDCWLVTFPKCGTTWASEMLWLLVNDCDFEKAAEVPLIMRAPFFEVDTLCPEDTVSVTKAIEQKIKSIENMASPRVIKTHLPLTLLHPKLIETSKVVYVARNPKDVMVSYYYHHKLFKFHSFNGDFENFVHYFMKDEILYSPFFPQILSFWEKRNEPNVLFLFYEDMKRDLKGEIKKAADFLGKTLSDEQLERLANHLHIDNFKENEKVNNEPLKKMGVVNSDGHFVRKGKTGDWKNHFTPELNAKVDSWIAKELEGSGLQFVMELDEQD